MRAGAERQVQQLNSNYYYLEMYEINICTERGEVLNYSIRQYFGYVTFIKRKGIHQCRRRDEEDAGRVFHCVQICKLRRNHKKYCQNFHHCGTRLR